MRRPDLPTGTVTFLFSDIEGSTRLAATLGPDRFRDLLERHNAALRGAFAAHGGVERGTQGDAFLAVFRDAPSAVAAAADGQRAIAAADWPAGVEVRVRMGLHSGEGIAGGDDYVGLDIDRAARIAGAAHGGQVVVSDATRALAERSLPDGVALRDLGEHRLRDIPHPERLFQLVIPGLTGDFPRLRSAGQDLGNLPTRPTSFIGRERELDELRGLLAERRLVTLTGPGGTGKTSLALELARSMAGTFEDGAWFVPFEAIDDPDLVGSAIVAALELRDSPGRPADERLADNLAHRRLLLVLDNFEHVLSAADLVAALIGAAPGVTFLVTSRAPLHLAAEQVFEVAPLPLPSPGGELDPEALATVPSIRLFIDRARQAQPAFRLRADTAEAVVEVCRRLDGLPLAIELAAARVALLGAAGVRDRLAGHVDLPGPAMRDAPARQRTLRDAVAWSHDLLDAPSRRLFARMAVFAGGCRVTELDAVCGPSSDLGGDVLETVAALVDQSLVRTVERGPEVRFEMLETIHDDALERFEAIGDGAVVARRHALAYLAMAEMGATSLPGRGQSAVLDRFALERDNFRLALRWAIETEDADVALRLVTALGWFWGLGGEIEEARSWCAAALAIPAPEMPTHARMRAFEAAGTIDYYGGDMAAAARSYRSQLELARELHDRLGIADALFNLPFTGLPTDEGNAALLAQADAMYRELGDERGHARVRWAEGAGLNLAGHVPEALAAWREAYEGARASGDARYEALAASSIAITEIGIGERDESARWFFEALAVARDMGDVAGITLSLPVAAAIVLELVGPEPAATIVGAHEALSRRFGIRVPAGLSAVIRQADPERRARAALDAATYDAALGRGRRMSADEVAAYVFGQVQAVGGKLGASTREPS